MPNANHKPKGRFFWSVGLQTNGTVLLVCGVVSN